MDALTEEGANSVKQREFSELIDRILLTEWRKALVSGLRSYNLKLYNIGGLSPKKVRELYFRLLDKEAVVVCEQPETQAETPIWRENELRIFLWVLLTYSELLTNPLSNFVINKLKQTDDQWNYLSKFFLGKQAWLCEFQFLNIRKSSPTDNKWARSEDHLLELIMKYLPINVSENSNENRWNEVAKQLFYRSNRRYFRSAKHCRERWNNYLDPTKFRGQWSAEEDWTLLNYALNEGKKWAAIARALDGKRTEHSVKNRYKSLLSRQLRLMQHQQTEETDEDKALRIILQRLSKSLQIKIAPETSTTRSPKVEDNSKPPALVPQDPLAGNETADEAKSSIRLQEILSSPKLIEMEENASAHYDYRSIAGPGLELVDEFMDRLHHFAIEQNFY